MNNKVCYYCLKNLSNVKSERNSDTIKIYICPHCNKETHALDLTPLKLEDLKKDRKK